MDNEGRTAALWACCRNHDVAPLRLLLNCGANLDTHDSKKRSPLDWAAFIGSTLNVEQILKTSTIALCIVCAIWDKEGLIGFWCLLDSVVNCAWSFILSRLSVSLILTNFYHEPVTASEISS